MTASRTAIAPNAAFGWDPERHAVEVERRSARGDRCAVDAVFVNGKHVGYVVARTSGRRREWDHVLGTMLPTQADCLRLTFPTTDRQHALTALVEATG